MLSAVLADHDERRPCPTPCRDQSERGGCLCVITAATLRALADERDAARAEAARLREALEAIAERSVGPQDRYDRYGPAWTSRKTGYEYEDASTHLEFAQEVGDMARAALAGGAE